MDKKKAQILVVDDHAPVRHMLRERLSQEPDLEVVGTAKDGAQALEMATRLNPDLVLLDIDMPGLSAFDAAQQITDQSPGTRVLFLSGYVQDAYIAQALQVRARGYTTTCVSSISMTGFNWLGSLSVRAWCSPERVPRNPRVQIRRSNREHPGWSRAMKISHQYLKTQRDFFALFTSEGKAWTSSSSRTRVLAPRFGQTIHVSQIFSPAFQGEADTK